MRTDGYTNTWTAISKPPYYTALALWPEIGTWGGGGLFIDQTTVCLRLHESARPHKDHLPPPNLNIIQCVPHEREDNIYMQRLHAYGWTLVHEGHSNPYVFQNPYATWGYIADGTTDPTIRHKRTENKPYRLIMYDYGYTYVSSGDPHVFRYALYNEQTKVNIPIATDEWADFDQQGRLVYVNNGALFAAHLTQTGMVEHQIADFNEQRPKLIQSPTWAHTWF